MGKGLLATHHKRLLSVQLFSGGLVTSYMKEDIISTRLRVHERTRRLQFTRMEARDRLSLHLVLTMVTIIPNFPLVDLPSGQITPGILAVSPEVLLHWALPSLTDKKL